VIFELAVPHQPELHGAIIEVHDVAMAIDHRGAQRRQSDDALQHLRDGDPGQLGG
jgi:hypothetical protein